MHKLKIEIVIAVLIIFITLTGCNEYTYTIDKQKYRETYLSCLKEIKNIDTIFMDTLMRKCEQFATEASTTQKLKEQADEQ